jgi:mannose-6-phosphate isomerase-like protein (cupin superfamily)
MEGWTEFRQVPPDVPVPTQGKLFLRNLLGSAGLEVSLNVVPPGQGVPFLHRNQENDEVYVVVGGRGEFLVDGECIDVAEGSALRLGPAAARAWRNNTDAPLYFLCLQYRADSVVEGRHRGRPEGRGRAGLDGLRRNRTWRRFWTRLRRRGVVNYRRPRLADCWASC